MGLELVLEGAGGNKYRTNPSRDLIYFWPELVALAEKGLVKEAWEPWYKEYLDFKKVGEDHLLQTLAAYQQFMGITYVTEVRSPIEALATSGFFSGPLAAQLVFSAKMGQLGTGAFWAGARSATPAGEIPATIARLAQEGQKFVKQLHRKWRQIAAERGETA